MVNRSSFTCLLSVVLLLSGGCATATIETPQTVYSPQLQPGKSFAQLKQDLETALKKHYVFAQDDMNGRAQVIYRNVRAFHVGDEDVSIDFANAEVFDAGTDKNKIDFTFRLYYSDFGAKPLDAAACKADETVFPRTGSKINFVNYVTGQKVGFAVCDALYNIGLLYKKQRQEERARFKEQAAQYRALRVKPKISEEQRRLIVQAESRREKKEYARAVELFREAVKVDAVSYPAAYHNMALLYGEQHRYQDAVDAMKQYLELMPDAKDARAAKDMIYKWEEEVR